MHALQAELFDETPELRTTLAFVVLQEARLRSIGYCVRDRVQAACRFAIKRHAVSSGLPLRDQAACSFWIKRDAAACRFAKHTCISLPTASCQAYLMLEMLPEGVLFPPIGEHYTHTTCSAWCCGQCSLTVRPSMNVPSRNVCLVRLSRQCGT